MPIKTIQKTSKKKCLLCENEPFVLAAFKPQGEYQKRLIRRLVDDGMSVGFYLCISCMFCSETPDRVERALIELARLHPERCEEN